MRGKHRDFRDLFFEETGRVFVDVAYRGCGSGCKYCYVRSAPERQDVVAYEDLEQVVEYINQYCQADPAKIVSFCPNTEPFKSKDSTERVLFVLRGLRSGQFHVQISTKEYISDELLGELDMLAQKNAIYINISMPFLEPQETEPGAADIIQRISNIERINNYIHLRCGLYIKPCTQNAVKHAEQYAAIVNMACPDYVCVGVAFDKSLEVPCSTLHRKEDAAEAVSTQKNLLGSFMARLKSSVNCPVIPSSICAVFQERHGQCSLNLWRYDADICSGCDIFEGEL